MTVCVCCQGNEPDVMMWLWGSLGPWCRVCADALLALGIGYPRISGILNDQNPGN